MIVSVIASVTVWGLIALLILRILNFSGLTLKNTANFAIYDFLCADLRRNTESEENIRALHIFIAAVIFRLIVFIFETIILMMYAGEDFTLATFLRRLEIWDSTNYFRIASLGYSGYETDGIYPTLVFFPLYPYTVRIINLVLNNIHVSLLTTSALAYAGGCAFLYKLCQTDYGSSTAKRAVIYVSIAPFACFFGAMMNESMLFFTSVAALYYIRKHNWPLAGVWGALAALSRLAGILVAVAAVVEWLEYYKIIEKLRLKQFKEVLELFCSKCSWIFLMLAGFIIYLLCNYVVTGNPLAFLEYQRNIWGHGSTYFGTGIRNIFRNAVGADQHTLMRMHIPSIASLIFVTAAMIYGARRNRTMYTAYLLAYFLINVSVDYIISMPRYMSCAIPAYIFLADCTARHKRGEEAVTIIMAISFGIFLVAYLHDFLI